MMIVLAMVTLFGKRLIAMGNDDVVGDHAGGRSVVVQVTGEGNREVVGLEKLCREGKAGEKVRFILNCV